MTVAVPRAASRFQLDGGGGRSDDTLHLVSLHAPDGVLRLSGNPHRGYGPMIKRSVVLIPRLAGCSEELILRVTLRRRSQ